MLYPVELRAPKESANLRRKEEASNWAERRNLQVRFRDQNRLSMQGYGVDIANTTHPTIRTDRTGVLPTEVAK